MKLLIVASEVSPPYGGMQTWLLDLIRGLATTHEITIVAPKEKDLKQLYQAGAKWVVPIQRLHNLSIADVPSVTQVLLSAAYQCEADVVHLAQSGFAFLAPPLAKAGFPSVLTIHGNDLTRPWLCLSSDPAARALALYEALQCVSRVTAVSRFSAKLAEATGVTTPITVIPNAVDSDFFHPADRNEARHRLGLPLDRPLLLSVGRLQVRKGFFDVLSALPKLAYWNPIYLIAGTGPKKACMASRILSRARFLGISERVLLLGKKEPTQLLLLYQAADIFVLPAYARWDEQGFDCEGFGIVFLEAASCGLPSVATITGGIPDVVVDGETGLLVPPRNCSALADAIWKLLEDPKRAVALGSAGRQRVEANFTRNRFAERMANIYREAIAVGALSASSNTIIHPKLELERAVVDEVPSDKEKRFRTIKYEKLKKLRQERGVSISELAELVGIDETDLCGIEAGTYPLPDDLVEQAAEVLSTFPSLQRSSMLQSPKMIFQSSQVIIYDNFLPDVHFQEVFNYANLDEYNLVHTRKNWRKTWRLHDGFPLSGSTNFYKGKCNHDSSKGGIYPTGTILDLFVKRIISVLPEVENIVGKEEESWQSFSMTPWIYPAETGLSLHHNGGVYSGSYTYFISPHWNVHWGGHLLIMDPSTDIKRQYIKLYGEEKAKYNRPWLNDDLENEQIWEPGLASCILPKPNRIVFIAPQSFQMISRVDRNAGQNPRVSIDGFFYTNT